MIRLTVPDPLLEFDRSDVEACDRCGRLWGIHDENLELHADEWLLLCSGCHGRAHASAADRERCVAAGDAQIRATALMVYGPRVPRPGEH